MDFLSNENRLPSVLDLIEGIRACYKSSSSNSSSNSSSSSSNSSSSSDASQSTDLGPEFLEVLVRDFATNQDWAALKRMGALSQENNTDAYNYSNLATKTISTISGRASFISPPPIPSPPSITNHHLTVTYDDIDDDENGEEYDDDESDKADMNSNSSIKNPYSKKVKFPGSTSLYTTFSGASRNDGSDVELSQGALGALERVQLQMKLLSAQADSLSLQADRLEAEMSQESNGIDVHRATVILKKRGDVLKTLRGKSDVLLAKTTIALSR